MSSILTMQKLKLETNHQGTDQRKGQGLETQGTSEE